MFQLFNIENMKLNRIMLVTIDKHHVLKGMIEHVIVVKAIFIDTLPKLSFKSFYTIDIDNKKYNRCWLVTKISNIVNQKYE